VEERGGELRRSGIGWDKRVKRYIREWEREKKKRRKRMDRIRDR
jgi:hypothetical protein